MVYLAIGVESIKEFCTRNKLSQTDKIDLKFAGTQKNGNIYNYINTCMCCLLFISINVPFDEYIEAKIVFNDEKRVKPRIVQTARQITKNVAIIKQ